MVDFEAEEKEDMKLWGELEIYLIWKRKTRKKRRYPQSFFVRFFLNGAGSIKIFPAPIARDPC